MAPVQLQGVEPAESHSTPASEGASAELSDFLRQLSRVNEVIATRATDLATLPTITTPSLVATALSTLPRALPATGFGLQNTTDLLLDTLCPALSVGQAGPRFFGLVTGGVTPAAQLADQLVTSFDPNVQVHLPDESISTIIEQQTLDMILDLLDLPHTFGANTFTTGATASNILGLSLAREHTISRVQARLGQPGWSVGESGFGGIEIDVFCAGAHASVAKSASLVGIGRRNVVEVLAEDGLCAFDLVELERRLRENVGKRGSVVVSSFGEVNTGAFTPGTKEIRELCDRYDAWLHVDAAFGAFASLHPDFSHISSELALADSITSDAHKWLNVPYDCGIFLSRSSPLLHSVLGPGTNAPAYLTPPTPTSSTPSIDPYRSLVSPLFLNIENSRRFRTLPVWASLVALGKEGYREIVSRNIEFARKVEAWMRDGGGGGGYEVLTPLSSTGEHKTLNILLFAPALEGPERFRGEGGAARLVAAINGGRECYVTATRWRGGGAIRMAVSNWGTTVGRDYEIVVRVLEEVMRG